MTRALQALEPDVDALAAPDRLALAALWGGAARGGNADVALLAEAVLVLTALGAPPALVGRAAGCTGEQAASAAAALALAEAYAGRTVELPGRPGLLDVPPGGVRRPGPALRRLAVRALREGWLLGGHTAQVTCWAAATSTDPAVRAALTVIARSEAVQAALWRDVLAWTLGQHPRLRSRLQRVELPAHSPFGERPAGADPAVLAAHGWPRSEEVARMWTVHRAGVVGGLS